MPVDDITKINSVLPTALQSQVQTSVPLATSPLNIVKNPVAVATAATQNLTAAQQAALLGSNAVQTLNLEPTSPIEPLLADNTTPELPTILESQGLSPAQEAALAVNETVQTALETQNLTPAQQAALAANQATQTLTAPLTPQATTIQAATAGTAGQTVAAGPVATTLATGTATSAALATTAATAAAVTATPATETAVASTGVTATQQAAAQPIQYQNAFAAYEVRNPTPPPAEPQPIRKDLHPPLPIGRVRPVDPLVLRQEWEKRKKTKYKESGYQGEPAPRPLMKEKAIRDLVRQANEDLAASGAPLHLVLAQNDEGFVLDVYDCSDDGMCQVTQEVPIDLNHLLTLLDNLEHEAGIIVNIKT
jgi:hypothetical protein